MDLRDDILQRSVCRSFIALQYFARRLRLAQNIYTLEECKLFLKELLYLASRWAEKDFSNLMYVEAMLL